MTTQRMDGPTELGPARPNNEATTRSQRATHRALASFAPPLLGGVVLGMGLTVLCIALDRAELPSPIPASLSWHAPDRVAATQVGLERRLAYAAAEVALVEDLLRGAIPAGQRAETLAWLATSAQEPGTRAWATALLAPPAPPPPEAAPVPPPDPPESPVEPWDEPALSDVFDPPAAEAVVSLFAFGLPSDAFAGLDLEPLPAAAEPEPEAAPAPATAPAQAAPATRAIAAAPPPPVAPADDDAVAMVEPPPPVEPALPPPPEPRLRAVATFIEAEAGEVAAVDGVVAQREHQLLECYAHAVQFDASVDGLLDVEWTVRDGRVTALDLIAESLGDEIAVRCMTDRIRRWRFDDAFSGQVGWRFTFDLEASSG